MEEDIPENNDDDDYEDDFESSNKKDSKPKSPEKPAEEPLYQPKQMQSYSSKPSFGVNKLSSRPKLGGGFGKKGSGGNPTSSIRLDSNQSPEKEETPVKQADTKPPVVTEDKPEEEDPQEKINRVMAERQAKLKAVSNARSAFSGPKKEFPWE